MLCQLICGFCLLGWPPPLNSNIWTTLLTKYFWDTGDSWIFSLVNWIHLHLRLSLWQFSISYGIANVLIRSIISFFPPPMLEEKVYTFSKLNLSDFFMTSLCSYLPLMLHSFMCSLGTWTWNVILHAFLALRDTDKRSNISTLVCDLVLFLHIF